MEIKLTADKKLLDAINHLAEAILACRTGAPAPEPKPEPEPERKVVPMPEPDMTAPERKDEPVTVTRDEVRSMATNRIQEGKRDELKALLKKFGAMRVSDVPEVKLAAFAAEMEAL